jgi:uncharacterized membrane protein
MTRQRTLSVVVVAYAYAGLLVAGPWIFTMVGIFGLSSTQCSLNCDQLTLFRSIVIYNSLFSLVVTSPLSFFAGRHVSDRLYVGESGCIFYVFLVVVAIFCAVTLVTAVPFYLVAATLEGPTRFAAVQNVFLIGVSWLLMPFLGVLRAYTPLLLAFGLNALAMVLIGLLLSDPPATSLIITFNVGFAITDSILVWVLVRRVGTHIERSQNLFRSFMKYPELPAAGLAYAVGIWGDKVIMWFSTGHLTVGGVLSTMPSYDTAMFWAQLASIPVIAVAFVHIETQLSVLLRRFYGRLDKHITLREMTTQMQKLRACIISSIATLFVALGIVAAMTILLSFVFMSQLGLKPSYMSILRIALWAMACHTSSMFCFVFFLYFDLRRQALVIVSLYAALSTTITLALLPLGEAFYGYGALTASAITFVTAFGMLLRELPWLHYHAFVSNNTSL